MQSLSKVRIGGNVTVVLTGPDGVVKYRETVHNLVTDVGDSFIAQRLYDDTVDIVTGTKLGTGTTAVAKNGAGAAMDTYLSGSDKAIDAAATDATKGAGAGWRTTYVVTYDAGEATHAALAEACLTNQTALADNDCLAADTVARVVFALTIDKQADDDLVVTWNVDALGATP